MAANTFKGQNSTKIGRRTSEAQTNSVRSFRMCLLQIGFYVLGISAVFTTLRVHMTLRSRCITNFAFITHLSFWELGGAFGYVLCGPDRSGFRCTEQYFPKYKLHGTFWMSQNNESVSKLKEPGIPGVEARVQIHWGLLAQRICSNSASHETLGKISGVTPLVDIINNLINSALLKGTRRLYEKSHLLFSDLNSVRVLLLISCCHSSITQDCLTTLISKWAQRGNALHPKCS